MLLYLHMAVWTSTELATQIEAIETEIASRITGKPSEYTIENASLKRMTAEELVNLRKELKDEYASLTSAASVAADTGNTRRIKSKFNS